MADYVRKQLSFNTQNTEEMEMLQVLDSFKKNQTNVVVFALTEFAEKYSLYGKSPAELEQFVKTYPYIKSYLGGMMLSQRITPVESCQSKTFTVSEPQLKTEGILQKQVKESTEGQSINEKEPNPLKEETKTSISNDINVSESAKASMNNILSMFSNPPG